ncbi:MAG: sulfurtransferase TusA family protein [Moraxella sp.]|jgi:TusA-related sulfurtransferase
MTNLMFSPSSFVIADALKKDPSFCQDWAWLEKVADKLPALTRQVAHYVDAKGLACPMPLLKLKMALRSLNIGDCVYLTATDPNSEHDIGAFCRHTGHSLVNIATPIVALTHLDKNTDTIFHLIITKNC